MNDSIVIPTQDAGAGREWILLFHQIPPKPDYFRVKVRRRLDRLGAVALKNSVYVLPITEDTMEDLVWLSREIRAEGGEVTLCRSRFVDGVTDADLEGQFRVARSQEYAEVARLAGETDDTAELERLRRRVDQIRSIDFFDAPGRAAAERALAGATDVGVPEGELRGRLWVTRPGVKVDRMASAWLIRRFIDPEARFAFDPKTPGIRFDTYEGEYTHEGDRCTFEVLLERFSLTDSALTAVAEVVHDIDCKDAKFGRPETPGIAALVEGIAASEPLDPKRLQMGAVVFEGLYVRFGTA